MPTDRGSTIPFILGMFLIALLLAGGAVAAGDAFVQQSQLQDTCDGAALAAAASAANVNGQRHSPGGRSLVLAAVQTAVDRYHGEDPARRDVTMRATLANDDATVAVHCTQTRSIAFGAWFGFRDGVHHEATSTAKAPLREALRARDGMLARGRYYSSYVDLSNLLNGHHEVDPQQGRIATDDHTH